MRTFMLTLSIAAAALMISSTSSPDLTVGAVALHANEMILQEPPPQPPPQTPTPQVNVEINREGGRAWYMSPTWMAIGAIGLVLLILLLVMASRGSGGPTVVKG